MSAKSDQKTINKCMLQILNTLVENDCRVKRIEPFCDTSSGFSITLVVSITLVGRFQHDPLAKISIYENEEKRTFIFQVDRDFSKIYADDMFSEITFNYTYIGEITKSQKENKVLYESKSVRSFDLRAKGNDADPVNHPNHYEMVGPFESFDIIVESLGIYGARQFCQGNIIKYQTRYKEKNGEEDLRKRHWYSRMDQMLSKCKTIEDYYKLKESDF